MSLNYNYKKEEGVEGQTYSALNLVNILLEFEAMTPNSKEWDTKFLYNTNPPRYYRWLRIKALSQAFFGNNSTKFIIGILNGEFILKSKKNIETYQAVFEHLLERYRKKSDTYMTEERLQKDLTSHKLKPFYKLHLLYERLISFKRKLREFQGFNHDVLEASSFTFIYAIHVTNDIITSIDEDKIKKLNQTISLILSPEQKQFTRKELEENYQFPEVDLHEVDLDWW